MTQISLSKAINALSNGEIIAYPTETVFGFGCDPKNQAALLKLMQLKQRDPNKGLILLSADLDFLSPYIDEKALSAQEWQQLKTPAKTPTTFIVPKSAALSPLISGAFDGVAIRISKHPIVVALSNALQSPIISTSANRSGCDPCLSKTEIEQQFGADFLILDGAIDPNARPSLIVDLKSQTRLR